MNRLSPDYTRFLEAAVKSLLAERGHDGTVVGDGGAVFHPPSIRDLIAMMEEKIAIVEWVEGDCIGIPEAFAKHATVATWLRVQGGRFVRVIQSIVSPNLKPCLRLDRDSGRGIRPGLLVEIE